MFRDPPAILVRTIKGCEGFARVVQRTPVPTAVPYLCPALHWTIGYGVLCDEHHAPITEPEGAAMLTAILPAYCGHALRLSPILIGESDERFAGIVDFIYNLGPTRYAASTLRRYVNVGQWRNAASEMYKWIWGGGKKQPGLVIRREIDAGLLLQSTQS